MKAASTLPQRTAIPAWLRFPWLAAAPLGLAWTARILWEKTVLTAREGEQMVGFIFAHMHPLTFVGGALCALLLAFWLLPAIGFTIFKRLRVPNYLYAMMVISALVLGALYLPDNAGLRFR